MASSPIPERLPIKLVLPGQGDLQTYGPGGSTKFFREVDDEFRTSLSSQLTAIETAIADQLEVLPVAPMRVRLVPEAFAKSHRPNALFSKDSCPIVGAGQLGELFVKATPSGIRRLRSKIETGAQKNIRAQLTTVQSIEPITPRYRRKNRSAREVQAAAPRVDDQFFMTRVRLFNFGDERDQELVVRDFLAACEERELPISRGGYHTGDTYAVACRDPDDVDALSRVLGVRSVIGMPT